MYVSNLRKYATRSASLSIHPMNSRYSSHREVALWRQLLRKPIEHVVLGVDGVAVPRQNLLKAALVLVNLVLADEHVLLRVLWRLWPTARPNLRLQDQAPPDDSVQRKRIKEWRPEKL